ncbi:MAG: amidohydrolase family protein [Propionibacterium sp.]|nr:amidohydrolase family protein [Propionibacterium sp.]MDN6565484.1 amidohydrolase family protein [Actinomyces sp.]MDN6794778.1 amidohydrolase family protein [Propionibacterium sp.]
MTGLLIRNVRIVPFRDHHRLARLHAYGSGDPHLARAQGAALRRAATVRGVAVGEPVDLLIRAGRVVEMGRGIDAPGAQELDAQGASALPGLWEAHAHLDLEAARAARLDLSASRAPEQALALVRAALDAASAGAGTVAPAVQGFGFRLAQWSRMPTVEELDAVSGSVPVVLISGDVHSGWLNSAALRALGVADPGGPLSEDPWFEVMNRLDELPGAREMRERGYRDVVADMVARGVCGVVDMTQPGAPDDWSQRVRAWGDLPLPRIRAAIYRTQLEAWVGAGLRTGDPLPASPRDEGGHALFTQGPLKVIADGSMGTCTAHTQVAYPTGLGVEHDHGVANVSRQELTELARLATGAGLDMAVHAIGDACLEDVAAALLASGARGRIEHLQLVGEPGEAGGPETLAALARAGIEGSVQPAHLLDDWSAVSRVWPGRESRCLAFADLVGAGLALHLGSDAPVAPLDPWLAMAVAVGREVEPGRVWFPEQRLTPEEAVAASVDGSGPVAVGSPADIVLCEHNPLAPATDASEAAERLRNTRPVMSVVAGRVISG